MLRQLRLATLAVFVVCLEVGATPATSPRLGIADVRVTDSGERTTVVAVDGQQRPVAMLVLVHGRFLPAEDYGPAYRGRQIEGRSLTVEVKGQRFGWETLGFSDTSRMPALPPGINLVAAFLADGRVRPVLERWRIGWAAEARPARPAKQDTDVVREGTNPVACGGLLCPIRSEHTATCAGVTASQAFVVNQDLATFGIEQDVVSACCGTATSGAFLVKTCAPLPGLNGCPAGEFCSECGNSGSNRCKNCSVTPYSTACLLSAHDTGRVNSAALPIFQIDHCGDGTAPPTITVGPAIGIWPPNHTMHEFTLADVASATSPCDASLDVNAAGRITSIASNEPGADEFAITGPSSFSVRADRNGSGKGRVYEITFSVTDALGNSSTAVGLVRVPHDQR